MYAVNNITTYRPPVETSPGSSRTLNVGAKRAHSRVEIGTPHRSRRYYRPSRRRRPRVAAAAAGSTHIRTTTTTATLMRY